MGMCKFFTFALAEEVESLVVVAEMVNPFPKAFHGLTVPEFVKEARILELELVLELKLLEH